jgi:predicted small secreted protein
LDATTGKAAAWNPNANFDVLSLAVSGTTVYAGGSFSSIGGQSRSRIAALDATTGNAIAWNPNANSDVYSLAMSGTTVYAGGWFTSIGGQSRNYIAALDATTGNAIAWNPNANSDVYSLAVSGTTVYAGGWFSSIGGQSRSRIAALDATTGNALAWNPNANGQVYSLAVSGTTVYAGGGFSSIGQGVGHPYFAQFGSFYVKTIELVNKGNSSKKINGIRKWINFQRNGKIKYQSYDVYNVNGKLIMRVNQANDAALKSGIKELSNGIYLVIYRDKKNKY